MNIYAVTFGTSASRGGYFKNAQLVIEANDASEAWSKAERIKDRRESVLYVERVQSFN